MAKEPAESEHRDIEDERQYAVLTQENYSAKVYIRQHIDIWLSDDGSTTATERNQYVRKKATGLVHQLKLNLQEAHRTRPRRRLDASEK